MIIIAEAGINHHGSLDDAMKLVDAAKYAGADAVKFQTFWNIYRLNDYELRTGQWIALKNYCDEQEITFLSTPHTFHAIHFLEDMVPMYKIASQFLYNPNFLMEVANKGKPVILSTGSLNHINGMATTEEIMMALKWLHGTPQLSLLQCVSKYPCEDSHSERIDELRKMCLNVGLSDHTKNLKPMKGLSIYEKHLKLSGTTPIDDEVSIDEHEFKRMVEYLRKKK